MKTIKTETQKNPSFAQNASKYGVAAAVAGTFVSNANALDVTAALTGNDASANIDTAAVWVLGIAVTIFCARKVIGFFSR